MSAMEAIQVLGRVRMTVFCPTGDQANPNLGSKTTFSTPGIIVVRPVWNDPPEAALYGISAPCGNESKGEVGNVAQPVWHAPPELRSALRVIVSFSLEFTRYSSWK